MQVLVGKRTMQVFRGGALTQVLQVSSNPRGEIYSTQVFRGEALVQVLAVGKRTV